MRSRRATGTSPGRRPGSDSRATRSGIGWTSTGSALEAGSARRRGGRPAGSQPPPESACHAGALGRPAAEPRRLTLLAVVLVSPRRRAAVVRDDPRAGGHHRQGAQLRRLGRERRAGGRRRGVRDRSGRGRAPPRGPRGRRHPPGWPRGRGATIPTGPTCSIAVHTASLMVRARTVEVELEQRRQARGVRRARRPRGAGPSRAAWSSAPARPASLGRHFELAPLGAPLGRRPAYRLVSYAEREIGRARFVGRERELRLLAERFEQARAGEGQVFMVVGEPGIGKSRLLQEFRQRLGDAAGVGRGARRALRPRDAVPPGRRHAAAGLPDRGRRHGRHRRSPSSSSACGGSTNDLLPTLPFLRVAARARPRRSGRRRHGPEAPPRGDLPRHAAHAGAGGRDPAARHGARGRALDGRGHGGVGGASGRQPRHPARAPRS